MNANLPPQMPAIKDWLNHATLRLVSVGIPSPSLDAEILLANALSQDRTYLHAHPEIEIDAESIIIANKNLAERSKRIPIAYIIGKKEFYGRQFTVTPATLIPRPESEDIIAILKAILSSSKPDMNLVDVGTGSGCLGITAKLESPTLDVTLTDISAEALSVATSNAKSLSADIKTIRSDLLHDYPFKTDIIVANLPYVDRDWERSPETDYEPDLALFADNNGTAIIERLIIQASNILKQNGYLIIESDPIQHLSLIGFAQKHSLTVFYRTGYVIAFKRSLI
jgi:release factor glutamine methyltransferase